MDCTPRSRKTFSLARRATGLLLAAAALAGGDAALAAPVPAQGLYDQCDPGTQAATCVEHLQRLGGAGFTVVLNYTAWYGNEADLRAYADAAAAAGVQIIWPLNDPTWRHGGLLAKYSNLAASCGCGDDASFQRYLIGLVSGLPATWGYYIGDELPVTELPAAQQLAASVRAVDSNHKLLYIANGNRPSPADEILPFADVADVVGSDSYPFGLGGSSRTVGIVGRALSSTVVSDSVSRAMVLQAFDWAAYPAQSGVTTSQFPSRDDMHAALEQAMNTASPSLVLWFSLNAIDKSADPAAHWADLVAAAFAPVQAASKETTARAANTTAKHRKVAKLVAVRPKKRATHRRGHRKLRGYEMRRKHARH